MKNDEELYQIAIKVLKNKDIKLCDAIELETSDRQEQAILIELCTDLIMERVNSRG